MSLDCHSTSSYRWFNISQVHTTILYTILYHWFISLVNITGSYHWFIPILLMLLTGLLRRPSLYRYTSNTLDIGVYSGNRGKASHMLTKFTKGYKSEFSTVGFYSGNRKNCKNGQNVHPKICLGFPLLQILDPPWFRNTTTAIISGRYQWNQTLWINDIIHNIIPWSRWHVLYEWYIASMMMMDGWR
jgi:hypothetical protein